MRELTTGRQIQVWEYHVSHGSLLIRSPAGPGVVKSIDIVFIGVEYLAVPRHLGEIVISEATADEMHKLEGILQKKLVSSRVWVLQGSRERFPVVAAALRIQEHAGDIFDSPFAA
jgi:uncharacterized protein YaiE (UPF0345 family)